MEVKIVSLCCPPENDNSLKLEPESQNSRTFKYLSKFSAKSSIFKYTKMEKKIQGYSRTFQGCTNNPDRFLEDDSAQSFSQNLSLGQRSSAMYTPLHPNGRNTQFQLSGLLRVKIDSITCEHREQMEELAGQLSSSPVKRIKRQNTRSGTVQN